MQGGASLSQPLGGIPQRRQAAANAFGNRAGECFTQSLHLHELASKAARPVSAFRSLDAAAARVSQWAGCQC